MSDYSSTVATEDLNTSLEKPIKEKKPRKPKTQAQLEQFEKVRLKLAEKRQQTKLDKEIKASQLLLSHNIELPSKQPIIKEDLPQAKPQKIKQSLQEPINNDEDDDDDNAPQIIIVKKKKKKQPKTIIVEETDSESDDEQQYINKVKEARNFISQQNKKSLIKVHKKNDVPNYFVD